MYFDYFEIVHRDYNKNESFNRTINYQYNYSMFPPDGLQCKP